MSATARLAPLLTVPQVAELLGVRARWVYEHLDELPHVRLGNSGRYVRFEPEAIRGWLDAHRAGNGDGRG